MFEDSLVSRTKRRTWPMVISGTFQTLLVLVLLMIPIRQSQALIATDIDDRLFVPASKSAPPEVRPADLGPPKVQKHTVVSPDDMVAPTAIPKDIAQVFDEGPPPADVSRGGNREAPRCIVCEMLPNTKPD